MRYRRFLRIHDRPSSSALEPEPTETKNLRPAAPEAPPDWRAGTSQPTAFKTEPFFGRIRALSSQHERWQVKGFARPQVGRIPYPAPSCASRKDYLPRAK